MRFDYALLLNADMPDRDGPVRMPAGSLMVIDTGFAQVWRLPGAASEKMSRPQTVQ